MSLNRHISPWGLYFTAIGSIIGSGWLLAPYYTAKLAGPMAIVAWLLAVVIIILVALTFAEISTKYPVSGGIVRLIQLTHGPSMSMLIGWTSWASLVMIPAIEVQASLQYCSHFFPQLIFHSNDHVTLFGFLVAAILMGLFVVVNSIGIKFVTLVNNYIGWWKIIIPVFISLLLLFLHFDPQNFSNSIAHPYPSFKDTLMSIATGGVIFAYVGFRSVIELAGEARNPQRDIPRTIIFALLTCALIYILLQIAFIGALDPKYLQHGWGRLSFIDKAGPLVNVVTSLGISWILLILYFDAVASPSGTSLIATATTSRVTYSMAIAGYLPKLFSKTNNANVPIYAILINYVVGLLFFLPFSGWQGMISFLVSTSVLAYALGPIVLMSMRLQKEHTATHFKLPFAKIMCPVIFYLCTLIIYWTGWNNVWKLGILIFSGLIIITLTSLTNKTKNNLFHLRHTSWMLFYLAALMVVSYLGHFGGKAILGFGIDFLVLAAISIITYWYALENRLPEVFEIEIN
ncbi:MAG: APC family permease [Gammaproteobacteria bacterium]|jgi:amino acid transporter|nr:APC family permease [Gammaproteobacteria bacterium]MBT4147207.1 APC family permease [Gammaproteobacteria bacterium]MBT5222126.1 APC family permease [Gammaproteobacteria bacterium]MBT5826661.1 APC family permease [Gammaproteobacteria bacterium]MBT5966749.1 APC family permease [Gammaproteobacteria bacterium]